MAGWGLGAFAALLGPHFTYATIRAVETFVVEHYPTAPICSPSHCARYWSSSATTKQCTGMKLKQRCTPKRIILLGTGSSALALLLPCRWRAAYEQLNPETICNQRHLAHALTGCGVYRVADRRLLAAVSRVHPGQWVKVAFNKVHIYLGCSIDSQHRILV